MINYAWLPRMQTPSLPPLELLLQLGRSAHWGGGVCLCVGAEGSLRVSAEGFGRVGGSAVLGKVGAVSSCVTGEPGQPGASRGQSSSRVLPGRGRGCLGVQAAAAYSLASE